MPDVLAPPPIAPAPAAAPTLPGLAAGATPTIVLDRVSKWFGDVVAVSDVSFGVAPGVTGLLGPNGAGKSTVLKMIAGLVAPSAGKVTLLGQNARGNPNVYRRLGLAPEQEQLFPYLSGREFLRFNAILQRLKRPDDAVARALALVDMADAADRKLGGYSKGMRQRIKVAAALVHDPQIVLMDEPLNGTDPVQRAGLIGLIRRLGDEGKTVVVSSHVLSEVERFAGAILVIVNGKLAAAGDYHAIRDRMDEHPHTVRIRADDPRRLAAALIAEPATRSVRIAGDGALEAETADVRAFARAVPAVAKWSGIRLREVTPLDESLGAVFAYLTEDRRG
jgi:ABC-2 type transport system ATP-binding protein